MKYTVEIADTADAELDDAYRWIRDEYSPEYAVRWRESLLHATETLERFPDRCAFAPESKILRRKIRQLVHGKRRGAYRILFEIQGRTVYILHIRHAARQRMNEVLREEDT